MQQFTEDVKIHLVQALFALEHFGALVLSWYLEHLEHSCTKAHVRSSGRNHQSSKLELVRTGMPHKWDTGFTYNANKIILRDWPTKSCGQSKNMVEEPHLHVIHGPGIGPGCGIRSLKSQVKSVEVKDPHYVG